jgi:hypothetical protein
MRFSDHSTSEAGRSRGAASRRARRAGASAASSYIREETMKHAAPTLATPAAIDWTELDTRTGLTARRNVLFGLWAARRLDLPEAEHEGFAWSVHFADLSEPGHDDVVSFVARAFEKAGIDMPERRLRSQLREMELRAALDLDATGPRFRSRRGGRA